MYMKDSGAQTQKYPLTEFSVHRIKKRKYIYDYCVNYFCFVFPVIKKYVSKSIRNLKKNPPGEDFLYGYYF